MRDGYAGWSALRRTLGTGHERQRQAPARWPATLLRGGVPRVTTWPRPVRGAASAGFHHSRCPPGPCRRTIMTVIAERISCASVDEVGALLPVVGGTTTVPLVDGTQRVYANLDYAASAPALEAVAARVTEVLPLYASVHRGAGYLSQVSTALYEQARRTIGAFVGARGDDVTIVTRNTTDALNLLAGCVPADP